MKWFVLCSGPSLTPEDIERVRLEHEAGRAKVIAVNSTIFAAPFADICYAWDHKWWSKYHQKVKALGCRMVSAGTNTKKYGTEVYQRSGAHGLGKDGTIGGNNSGHQAINLAYSMGAEEIVILGFDCGHVDGKAHHHKDHPEPLGNAKNAKKWIPYAKKLAQDLKREGIKVVNCSPQTSARFFPVMTLEQYLGG